MIERFLNGLERVARIQPQLTILILLLVLWGDYLVATLKNFIGLFL